MAIAYESDGGTVFAANASNAAITVPLPATRPVGSVLLFVGFSRLITDVVGTAPSGYTLLNTFTSATASGGRIWLYAKEVVGGEAAPTFACTSAATGNTGDLWGACIYCYSGVDLSGGISAILDGTPQTTDASGTTTNTFAAITNSKVGNQLIRFLARFRDAADTFTPTAAPAHTEREDASSTTRTGAQHFLQGMTTTTTGSQASVTVAPSNATAARYLSVSALLKKAPDVFTRSAAIDATGAVATSSRVSPQGVHGAELILDASRISGSDGDPVTTWSDGSGLGNNASGGTPSLQTAELNGLPVIRFDGVDDFLTVSGIVNNDATRTVFLVARGITHTGADGFWGLNNAARLEQGTEPTIRYATTEAGGVSNLGSAGPGTPFVAAIRYNGTSSADRFLNAAASSNFDPNDAYQSATGSVLTVGARTSAGLSPGNVDIAAVYVFDSALSDTDVDTIRNWLIDTWIPVAATHERSAAIAATADVASAGTFFTTFERSAAISATAAVESAGAKVVSRSASLSAAAGIASSGIKIVSRSATLSAAAAIVSDGHAILSRSATISATATVASSATFWTTFERSASLAATAGIASSGQSTAGTVTHERSASLTAVGGIASSGVGFTVFSRSASLTAMAGIASAPQRVRLRSASLTATGQIATAGRLIVVRSAALSALAGITSAGEISGIVQRSASLSATATIQTAHRRELQRRVAITAAAGITTNHRRDLQRAASLSALGGIASEGTVGAVVTAAAELAAVGNIAAAGRILEEFERAAAISAIAAIETSFVLASGRWPAASDGRWPGASDDEWPADSDEDWEEATDDRWLVSAESRW